MLFLSTTDILTNVIQNCSCIISKARLEFKFDIQKDLKNFCEMIEHSCPGYEPVSSVVSWIQIGSTWPTVKIPIDGGVIYFELILVLWLVFMSDI